MSELAELNTTFSKWYKRERPQFAVEARSFNEIDLTGVRQPAGAFPDPPGDFWLLQIMTKAEVNVTMDFGAGAIRGNLQCGHLLLSTSHTQCAYHLDGDHEVIAISLPANRVSGLLREIDPEFSGHFGHLHAQMWRDNAIRDYALRIWRASKGDGRAPVLDPDEALLQLAVKLAQKSQSAFSPQDADYHLAPTVRRRVVDFVEAHIDEDLALFRLAKVAELSPFHFARAFRMDMGDTPHQYVTRRRLRRAEEMLGKREASIAQVALACGYSSQSRLNEAFVRELGITPGQMRRILLG